jgi:hypothetical protein
MTHAEHVMEDYLKERKLVELVEKHTGLSKVLNTLEQEVS